MNSRQWFLVSVLLLGAAAWFWHLDEVRWQRLQGEKSGLARQQTAPGQPVRPAFALQSKPYPALAKVTNNPAAKTTVMAKADTNRFPFRLRNTPRSVDELSHSDTAILLQNAFLDTANGTALQVPPHLRAGNAAGSYVVQSRGVIDDRFRAALRDAGATTISYIPNNAYLVRADEGAIQSLSASPSVQAVMPFDPYFKLDEQLLPLAVKQEPLPPESMLRVTLFPDERDATLAKFQALGVETIGEDRSPFGPVLMVRPPAESLVALANIPSVQGLEVYNHRVLHNDLARVRMSVATDTVTTTNYNGLTGKGIMVSLNDTGVDVSNPDLAGRVFSNDTNTFTLQDLDGHGTHTAGTIASSGASSASVKYASGSVSNANFRGQAPQAKIFILPVFLTTGPLISDAFVQETAARTNAFVSNNSWGYPGVNNYGSVSASYDAAVRDALPTVTGSQPLLYVFSAGNSGEGDNGGQGGIPGSVTQPGTGKNVITVGATENLRQLTNTVIFTNMVDGTNVLTTNQFYFGWTDSDDEVAFFSSRGNVSAGTEGSAGRFKPDVVAPGTFIVSTRSRYWNVDPRSPLYTIDKELNDPLAPVYRYESGTSMAAPAVSGMLVLMQEFFEQRMRQTNSPAAMKALLINGARPVARQYDYNTRASINYQGWGMVNLTNSVPLFYNAYAGKSINDVNPATAPVPHFFFDQSSAPLPAPGTAAPARPQNHALATGQTDAWQLNVTDDGSLQNLRFTLVWTDPPGNPAAAVKLVNDLDLVVSNTVTHEVFYGNNIPDGADFTQPQDPGATAEQVIDSINNVENVFLRAPLDSSYVVSVFARKVNVNAVVGNTNDIVQDYALVISSGQGDITNAFTLASLPTTPRQSQAVSVVTNGVALLNQHVGANFPLTNSTAGQTNQWNFYIFTNLYQQSLFGTLTNGSNVAFVTFLPPNLGTPRNEEADIDLYVSTNPAITNLD
ncbi:MAG TPA: S8 family serine peptidase, partial [Verrucomicrobiae bacterium]|nr:S8 family serine peptidase [Verrucomicrobiae bacterium]